MTTTNPASARRADLDWLRVVCILVLLVFHVGMYFVPWGWHIKNPQLLPALAPPMEVLHLVRMPLLMVIAGVATALALGRRSLGAFAWDRVRRLVGPLAFGMLVIVPPQIYVERLDRGQLHGSFWQFWPSLLRFELYPKGDLSWHHLWFVAYLACYSLAALPLFAWLRRPRGAAFAAWLDGWLARGWNLALLWLPLAAVQLALRRFPTTNRLFDDPRTVAYYGLLFLYGHLFGRGTAVWQTLVARRRRHLVLLLILMAIMLPPNDYPYPFETLGAYALMWLGLVTALGYARAHVVERRPWLEHAQGLAYPFYIVHQTVIIVAAFALRRFTLGPWSRLALLLAVSFVASWALCEAVARVDWLRPCLGMGPRRRATRAATVPAMLS